MSVLTDIVSPELRKKLYAIFGVIGLALGAVQVGFASAGVDQPTWVQVALSVLAFVGAGFGFTAAANTDAPGDEALDGPLTDEIEAAEAPVEPTEG